MHATEHPEFGTDAIPWGRFAYSVKDTATLLSVSERMVRYLCARGELESFKVGAARRIHGTSLWEYIRRTSTAPEVAS